MIWIIGAGWYGCHIALHLQQHGYTVRIIDKANAFFTGSSAHNQNRLHLGYHYPRSPDTIEECQRGFKAFKATYPFLSTPIPNNLYLIAAGPESKSDINSFSRTFGETGELLCLPGNTPFEKLKGLKPVMFRVAEEYIDNETAREFFTSRLLPHFQHLPPNVFGSVSDIRRAVGTVRAGGGDWIINCTYNQLEPIPMAEYELYCSLVYRIPANAVFAITIMDGPYFSIYPYDLERQLYTVTSVRHGAIWRGTRREDVGDAGSAENVGIMRALVEAEVEAILPEFPTRASYHSYFLSWKTKPVTDCDDRSVRMDADIGRRLISVYGGKITGIFDAAEAVRALLPSPQK